MYRQIILAITIIFLCWRLALPFVYIPFFPLLQLELLLSFMITPVKNE